LVRIVTLLLPTTLAAASRLRTRNRSALGSTPSVAEYMLRNGRVMLSAYGFSQEVASHPTSPTGRQIPPDGASLSQNSQEVVTLMSISSISKSFSIRLSAETGLALCGQPTLSAPQKLLLVKTMCRTIQVTSLTHTGPSTA
jgi:hypothetical protein